MRRCGIPAIALLIHSGFGLADPPTSGIASARSVEQAMAELFAPDGYLAALRAKGYEVIEPE